MATAIRKSAIGQTSERSGARRAALEPSSTMPRVLAEPAPHADRADVLPASSGAKAGRSGFLRIAVRIGRRLAGMIADEVRVRRDMQQLMGMSDHMLKDIGITRAEIGDAVRYGRD